MKNTHIIKKHLVHNDRDVYIINDNILKSLCEFEKGCYILMCIARKKENISLTQSTEIVYREIITSMDDYYRKKEKLLSIMSSSDYMFRLYVSQNPRCPKKAYKMLKTHFANWDYEQNYDMLVKIEKSWYSSLQKSKSCSNYFILDVDTTDVVTIEKIKTICKELNIIISFEIPTKNGWHILINPSNKILLEQQLKDVPIEIKTDDMVCIGFTIKNGTEK